MTGRETLIGAGLAVVLVVGIIDAAAGHDDSSTQQPSGSTITTAAPTMTASTPPTSTPAPHPTKSKGRKHPGGDGATTAATPKSAEPSATPSKSAKPKPKPSATPKPTEAVPPGVLGTFTYATTGSEQTNIPGTHRDFPKKSEITNKLEGCGVSSTWKPVPQHVQKQVLCPASDGIKVSSYETSISFFGVTSGENFQCSGPSYIYREGVSAGDVRRFKCKAPDATAVQKSEAVGFQTINVDGTRVRTLHVHVETHLQGQDAGTSTQDYWIATKQPVLVKERGKVAATQQGVHYESTYSLTLTSLSPRT
jgi:hypothetical protein